MTISAVNPATGEAQSRKTEIAGDFDTFLRLLTTQLANQDPLSPMDSNQFTEQLVQFATVEQSVATNEKLDRILGIIDGDKIGSGANYLGREVEAEVSTLPLAATGVSSFTLTTPEKPAEVRVTVRDEKGAIVAQLLPPPAEGRNTVVWDGRTKDGIRAPAGTYRIAVEAADMEGQPLPASTGVSGLVSAVENDNGALFLAVDGQRIALADVTSVRMPTQNTEGASS